MTYIKEWLHNCIRCGNCKYAFRHYYDSCPSGREFRFETYFASGRVMLARGIERGEIAWDQSLIDPIYACTTCGSCEVQCLAPHREHIVDIIEELRCEAVRALGPVPEHKRFSDHVMNHHNPYGADHHARTLAKKHRLSEKADVVYFIGCTSNYRETAIRDSTISVLKKAGVDFTIVDEYCCSSPLLRTGQIAQAPALAQHNVEAIRAAEAETVVTSCSGCFRTLTKDYPRLGFDVPAEVCHSTQFVKRLLDEGALTTKNTPGTVTYHDPCHLGRHCGVYDEPRNVIMHTGLTLKEMDASRENAWCCGAGGGVRSAYSDWSLGTASERIAQAQAMHVDAIVSACPFCKRNLTDAARGSVKVIDVVELIDSQALR